MEQDRTEKAREPDEDAVPAVQENQPPHNPARVRNPEPAVAGARAPAEAEARAVQAMVAYLRESFSSGFSG